MAEYKEAGSGTKSCIIWFCCNIWGCSPCGCFLYDCPLRAHVAEKRCITGDNGMLMVVCCQPCSTCQVTHEIKFAQQSGGAPTHEEMQ